MYNTRNSAREERKRDQLAAGLLSERFPDVTSIVVTMSYRREKASEVLRTVNFYPGTPAFFRISCLGEGCERGGLDLTPVIDKMVRKREKSAKGRLKCENRDPAVLHADVDFNVTITFS